MPSKSKTIHVFPEHNFCLPLYQSKQTLAFVLPSTLYIVLLSAVQTLLYPNLLLAFFNPLILIFLKLSVIAMFFPFSLFWLENIHFQSIYLPKLMITGLFLPLFGTPILCVQSISLGELSKSISLLILFTTTSSVSLF